MKDNTASQLQVGTILTFAYYTIFRRSQRSPVIKFKPIEYYNITKNGNLNLIGQCVMT
jgi:hypothetical protein